MASRRELDCIADKIGEHLPNVRGVSDKSSRRLGGIRQEEVDLLIAGFGRQQIVTLFDDLAKVEWIRLDVDLAGLDLGIIQYFVDDAEQVFTRQANRLGKFPLRRCELGVEQ